MTEQQTKTDGGATAPRTERIGPAPHLAVDVAGDGPLVVFLHGIGGNRSNWAEQLAHFADRYTAVAWDARGWGGSDDYDGPLTFEDFAADLCRVLDHFGAERAHLVGLSMGSRICLDFWGRHPGRIRSLTLTAASAGMHKEIGIEKRREFLAERKRPLIEGGTTADMAAKVSPKLISPTASQPIRQRAYESLAALRKDSYLKALDCVTWYEDFPPFYSIAVPALVISGTDDYLAPPDVTAEMAARIPGSQRVLIEDCGHLANFERPERFNAELDRFLAAAEAGGPEMLQERIEAKWIATFMDVFRLCNVKPGEVVGIVCETQSRPVNVRLAELALGLLEARAFILTLPTPALKTRVPVRSSGTTDALQQIGPVVAALRDCDMVVDMTVEGLQHAPERAGIFSGDTRLIYISDEHPEQLERCKPDPAMADKVGEAIRLLSEATEMRVTSAAGTDLTVQKAGVRAGGHWGPCPTPGSRGMWPSGIVACYPPAGGVNGVIVLDRGDINLTFKRYLESPVTLVIEDDFVREVLGDGLDAELTRSYFAAWEDEVAYATSHVGWGMNPHARWDAMTMYDRAQTNGVEQRAFAGNFLYSTGANEAADRYTLGHFDLPLRNCTIDLDGARVVEAGQLCPPLI